MNCFLKEKSRSVCGISNFAEDSWHQSSNVTWAAPHTVYLEFIMITKICPCLPNTVTLSNEETAPQRSACRGPLNVVAKVGCQDGVCGVSGLFFRHLKINLPWPSVTVTEISAGTPLAELFEICNWQCYWTLKFDSTVISNGLSCYSCLGKGPRSRSRNFILGTNKSTKKDRRVARTLLIEARQETAGATRHCGPPRPLENFECSVDRRVIPKPGVGLPGVGLPNQRGVVSLLGFN
jgi:hypothetical protein